MNNLWLKLKESFQNQPEPTTKQTIGAWAAVVCVGLFIWSMASSKDTKTARQRAATEQTATNPEKSVETAKAKPVPPTETSTKATDETPPASHNYAMEDNGVYGYEQDLSEDDKNAGMASKPMLMVRYLGQENGRYTIVFSTNENFRGMLNYASCADPCSYIKVSIVMNGQTMHSEIMPAGHTLAAAVMEDAMTGQLKAYHKARKTQHEL